MLFNFFKKNRNTLCASFGASSNNVSACSSHGIELLWVITI